MARAYTKTFGQGAFSAPGGQLLYTARPDYTTIVRDIVFCNFSGSPQLCSVSLTGQGTYLLRVLVEPDQTFHSELRQVVLPGDSIAADSASTSWTVMITGYELLNDDEG